MTEETNQTPELMPEAVDTSSVMRCYVLLGLGTALAFTNLGAISAIAMGAMIWGIIWAYRIRKKADADGLVANHARWLVRSFWVSSLYALVAIVIWTSVVHGNADFSGLNAYLDMIKTGVIDHDITATAAQEFMKDNERLIFWTTLATHGPVVLFVLARFIKGYRLADAGKPIANLKTWSV